MATRSGKLLLELYFYKFKRFILSYLNTQTQQIHKNLFSKGFPILDRQTISKSVVFTINWFQIICISIFVKTIVLQYFRMHNAYSIHWITTIKTKFYQTKFCLCIQIITVHVYSIIQLQIYS